jgi:hypothetical protein
LNSDPTGLAARVRNAAKTLALLYSPALLVLVLAFIAGRASRAKGRASGMVEIKTLLSRFVAQPLGVWAAVFAILPLLAILALYLLGLSPGHAFSSRYLGFFSPLVAILPALYIVQTRQVERLAPLYYAGLFALGLSTLLPGLTQSQQGWVDGVSLNAERYVVIDSIQWGTWPGVVQNLDGEQEVFGDGQEQLLANPEDWIKRAGSQGFVYVSIVRGIGNTPAGREKILALLGERYKVEELSEAYRPQDWSVRIYRVRPAP